MKTGKMKEERKIHFDERRSISICYAQRAGRKSGKGLCSVQIAGKELFKRDLGKTDRSIRLILSGS